MSASKSKRVAEKQAAGVPLGWSGVPECGSPTRRVLEGMDVTPEDALLWVSLRPLGGRTDWVARDFVRFLREGGTMETVRHAVRAGLAADDRTRTLFYQVWVKRGTGWLVEVMPRVANWAMFRLADAATSDVDPQRASEPRAFRTPLQVRQGWIRLMGQFTTDQAVGWMRHPAADRDAPPCLFVAPGWEQYGSMVPWFVAGGYLPKSAPQRIRDAGARRIVAETERAVAAWDTGVVDPSKRWWSVEWYGRVGIPKPEVPVFLELGWEPPLAGFMRRWTSDHVWRGSTIRKRFAKVPVTTLRAIWRESLTGTSRANDFHGLTVRVPAEEMLPFLRRVGSVQAGVRLVQGGVSWRDVAFAEDRWPGNHLFDWVHAVNWDATGQTSGMFGDHGGWLRVAAATSVPGAPAPLTATISDLSTYPGWVPDFLAAGITTPGEAEALLAGGVTRESLSVMAALRA